MHVGLLFLPLSIYHAYSLSESFLQSFSNFSFVHVVVIVDTVELSVACLNSELYTSIAGPTKLCEVLVYMPIQHESHYIL